MTPLVVLATVALIARGLGAWRFESLRSWPAAVRAGLAVMFCFTATAHFSDLRDDLIRMVPPWVPAPELAVTWTGVCEVLGGIGLLIPSTRRLAAGALIVFLLAVLPANIHASNIGATLGGAPVTPLWPRVGIQVVFVALLWWSGVRGEEGSRRPSP